MGMPYGNLHEKYCWCCLFYLKLIKFLIPTFSGLQYDTYNKWVLIILSCGALENRCQGFIIFWDMVLAQQMQKEKILKINNWFGVPLFILDILYG
jgi:hypothetical protein